MFYFKFIKLITIGSVQSWVSPKLSYSLNIINHCSEVAAKIGVIRIGLGQLVQVIALITNPSIIIVVLNEIPFVESFCNPKGI